MVGNALETAVNTSDDYDIFKMLQMFHLISMESSDLHLDAPVDYSSMYNLQNNDSLCTVFEEV